MDSLSSVVTGKASDTLAIYSKAIHKVASIGSKVPRHRGGFTVSPCYPANQAEDSQESSARPGSLDDRNNFAEGKRYRAG